MKKWRSSGSKVGARHQDCVAWCERVLMMQLTLCVLQKLHSVCCCTLDHTGAVAVSAQAIGCNDDERHGPTDRSSRHD